jgi:hypothetical protein
MSTSVNTRDDGDSVHKTWKRRGVFAAATALVAAVVGKVTEQRVLAGTDGDVVLGGSNTETTTTTITNISELGTGLVVTCTNGMSTGLTASGSHFGVIGDGTITGVTGRSLETGVSGITEIGVGVSGRSMTGTGMLGTSSSGIAVYGQVPPSSDANTIAMYAQNYSTYAGPSPGAGGFAIYGLSANGHGLVGATAATGAAAVVGATNGVVGAYAGSFFGPVVVSGAFTVVGGPKSAAVPHPDGTHRRLYCVESPESWFEDFGQAALDCGQATIELDPDFAAVIDTAAYHVFLTGYDDFELRVSERGRESFHVQAKNAASQGRFSWRVVAKRKDIKAARFETVTIPAEPVLPSVPDRS